MILPIKEYLGDSVYIEYDGRYFTLTTENGIGASNRIHLDNQVLDALQQFILKLENMD